MKKLLFLGVAMLILQNTYPQTKTNDIQLFNLVNPFIGTDLHGHTYPGVIAPFGMVQLSPDTRIDGWDGCSGYHYSDKTMYGFSHTHLSGTGCLDYGDILFIPTTKKQVEKDYQLLFSHNNEDAHAGYYKVKVVCDKSATNNEIVAELTATPRAGYHRYTYPKQATQKTLIIDLKHRDSLLACSYKIIDKNTVVGLRRSRSWNENQFIYFAARFSNAIKANHYDNQTKRLYLYFDNSTPNTLEAVVSISSVNTEGALKNLNAETCPSFDIAKKYSESLWDKELSKIKVEGGTLGERKTFYTAFYHTMLSPNLYSDVDGRYRGMDEGVINNVKQGKIYTANGYERYTVFSLWDTYRTFHPLMSIIEANRTKDWINTFLDIARQNGVLPVWELASFETYCMIGMHGISMITDALMKGVKPDNLAMDELLKIYIQNANALERKQMYERMQKEPKLFGLDAFDQEGYIALDKEHESVSKTLEFAYNMWCIAQVAKLAGNEKVYSEYIQKAQYYKNLFNPKNTFIQPRENGRFIPNFDAKQINQNYTEANGWQYAFYVPQDVQTLIELTGQDSGFCKKLDECFNSKEKPTGRTQADVTGLIGQYAHGNEPSQHMAYLYAYAGQPYKTQKLVRQIMQTLYTDKPDGICGNEDAGQMSAWYIMSAMGFYPVCPGSNQYVIGSPLFDKITITLENGKTFTIIAKNQSPENIYVESVELKSKHNYKNKTYISQADIINGGELIFEMGNIPNKQLGVNIEDRPSSKINDHLITIDPIFEYENRSTFTDSKTLTLSALQKDTKIFYRIIHSGSNNNMAFTEYKTPLTITQTGNIEAYCEKDNIKSKTVTCTLIKIPKGRKITLLSKYDDQYTANGPEGLIDQIRGSLNWRLGGWQGYVGKDIIAIIDLGSKQKINRIGGNFLQDISPWIFMPLQVNYYISDDNKNFTLLETVHNPISEKETKVITHTFFTTKPINARYIKMEAITRKTNPSWHLSNGEKSYTFIDEIIIE